MAYSQDNMERDELKEISNEALKFSQTALERFVHRTRSRIHDPKSDEVFAILLDNLQRRINMIKSMDEILSQNDTELFITMLNKLEDVSFDIFGIGFTFGKMMDEAPKLSPLPVFDDFLKLVRNVIDGHEEPEQLSNRMEFISNSARSLTVDKQRFAIYYPGQSQVSASFQTAIEQLDKGLTTIKTSGESGDRALLPDALKLVVEATKTIDANLKQIAQIRKSHGKSSNSVVDDFLHGTEGFARGLLTREQFQQELGRINDYAGMLFSATEDFRQDNLVNVETDQEFTNKFDQQKSQLSSLVQKIASSAPTSPEFLSDANKLAGGIQELIKTQQEYVKIAARRVDMTSIPTMAELQQAIVGVYRDVVTFTTLENLLIQTMRRFQSLYQRLKKLPEGVEELDELKKALARMLEGLSVTSSFFLARDRSRLSKGLGILEGSYRKISIAEETIARFEQMGTAKECVSCGFRNLPDAPLCRKCGKQLPTSAAADLDRFEMVAEEHGATMIRSASFVMREVEILENLIRAMEKGEEVGEAIRAFIEVFTVKINETLKRNEFLILPIVQSNPDDPYLPAFYDNFMSTMELFRQSANEISLFLIFRNVEHLRKGLSMLRQAQQEMVELTDQMQHTIG